MDNFNLQKFVKKSKNEFYTNLYEGKTKPTIVEGTYNKNETVEEDLTNDDRIEGLLNIKLKQAFLDSGKAFLDSKKAFLDSKKAFLDSRKALIDDLLEDSEFEISDVTTYLAKELRKHYGEGLREGEEEGIDRDQSQSSSLIGRMGDISLADNPFDTENDDESAVEEVSMNASDLETAMALLGGILGLPTVAILSQKAQDKLKAMKAKGKEALTEEEEMDVDIEDEVPTEVDVDMDMDMEAPESEAENNKEIFSKLVDAYESAKALGDEKLTRQLANTITYFNKSVIFGDTK